MTAHPPPVPPANRAPHEGEHADKNDAAKPRDPTPGAAVAQNTTNKGHQQDR